MPADQRYTGSPADTAVFLPDFCQIRALLLVVIIAELLAFVLTLAPAGSQHQRWNDLGLISLFVQWVALSGTFILCIAKPWLVKRGVAAATIAVLAIMAIITAAVSEATFQLAQHNASFGLGHNESRLGFIARNVTITLIISAIALRYFYVQYQSRLSIRAEARARLHALQARIRPHFLFNSMNTIASLTRSQPALAETVVEDLADLFRNNLNTSDAPTRLGDEIDLAQRYLNIEQLRLGKRLRTDWRVDSLPKDAAVPPLLLQPLVENAVYHGIEPRAEGGVISISGAVEDDHIRLEIRNPVSAQTATTRPNKGHGMALENTRQRLAGWYGGEAVFEHREQGGQFIVSLSIPYRQREER